MLRCTTWWGRCKHRMYVFLVGARERRNRKMEKAQVAGILNMFSVHLASVSLGSSRDRTSFNLAARARAAKKPSRSAAPVSNVGGASLGVGRDPASEGRRRKEARPLHHNNPCANHWIRWNLCNGTPPTWQATWAYTGRSRSRCWRIRVGTLGMRETKCRPRNVPHWCGKSRDGITRIG